MSELVVGKLTNQDPYIARATINFNGTGVIAIRDSKNVASIVDGGVGNFTIYFDVSFSDTTFSGSAMCGSTAGIVASTVDMYVVNVGYCTIRCHNHSGGAIDRDIITCQFFGNQ